MGLSYSNSNSPQMCFNAPKNWQLGWYEDRQTIVNNGWNGKIYGIANYVDIQGANDIVIAQIPGSGEDWYISFNRKTGINAGYKNLIGSLQYTYLSKQYTDASNARQNPRDNQSGIQGEIPAYDIVDLSLSFKKKWFKIESGINNLLDKSYFTRRATGYPGPGIIPSPPRTYYVTLQLQLK